jgi:polyhydroxybutyrate depolymerase
MSLAPRASDALGLAAAWLALAVGLGVTACSSRPAVSDPYDGSSSSSSSSSGSSSSSSSGDAGGDAPTSGGRCSVAGAGAAPKGYLAQRKLTVAGVKDPKYGSRTYDLLVPPGHDGTRTYPLVFEFHGDGGNGAGMRKALDLETASQGGAILVYPDGFGSWDLESAADQNDDIRFVRAMVDAIGGTYCVDTSRVFATGFSNGAFFSNQLGCKVGAPFFRGIAAHAGGGPFGPDADYDAQGNLVCAGQPVAALIGHGQSDGNVLLKDGVSSRDHWQRVNGCAAATQPWGPSPCVTYDGCAAGRPLVYCEIPGLGHAVWSSGAAATWKFLSSL